MPVLQKSDMKVVTQAVKFDKTCRQKSFAAISKFPLLEDKCVTNLYQSELVSRDLGSSQPVCIKIKLKKLSFISSAAPVTPKFQVKNSVSHKNFNFTQKILIIARKKDKNYGILHLNTEKAEERKSEST